MAKPKKAKQTTKASEASRATERPPEPSLPEVVPAAPSEPHEVEPPPHSLSAFNPYERGTQPSASKPHTAPVPSQEEDRNLDQDNGVVGVSGLSTPILSPFVLS